MAPITSDCDAMRLPEHQMALITSECDDKVELGFGMGVVTAAEACL